MNQFLQQLINGLSLGSIYALIALGYTMVYGIIKLINFAHGEIYMLGAYTGFLLITTFKLSFIPALLLAMVICAVVGMLIEKVAYRPLRKSSRIAALITAIGVSFLLQYTMIYFMGSDVRSFPGNTLPSEMLKLGEIYINQQQIIIFAITIILMVALQLIVKKTKLGKAMRAVSVDSDTAKLMGINPDTTISFTFALGSALAAAAGVMVGAYYTTINPFMGSSVGLKAFIAAVFGGIGSIPGAMVGGFVIGLIETFTSAFGASMWKDAIVYGILIIILLVRPAGLLGKNVKEKV